ncbi:TetR/AcrR family transcriptional regulator [Sphingomonas immobilis]|uniref:TetR/AcrR family transcriptional regulator n=1 Tax=Sphingomonas immobilis TaxID=3063997 RepID=A0ABT9A394_9SPHN|nr:TetR/AcrR family transcriptional regulator [Sphingomonas sp. CA1-15]MDO7843887.1 TetR/AcrR family transcriptional regulator [Sphingomonas sp. CA1-15]
MAETYHHGGLRQALICATLEKLAAGEEPPSLREVARAAGVSAMAPYRHFADRAALLSAVADHGFTLLHQHLAAADASGEGGAAVIAQGRAYVDFALANPALFRLMFSGEKRGSIPTGETAYDVLSRRVIAIAPHASAPATLACWGLVHGLATLALDGRVAPLEGAAVDAALTLLVDGLVAGGSTAAPSRA